MSQAQKRGSLSPHESAANFMSFHGKIRNFAQNNITQARTRAARRRTGMATAAAAATAALAAGF